jgi:hypothetical protein
MATEFSKACTTIVASGRATADGRPLLWKNRDTSERHNEVVWSDGGRLACVAVVNAGSRKSIWMGINEAGFCVQNSVIKDLPGGSEDGPGNGEFMKLALETCESVADFEALLEKTNSSGRRTKANFGVIDARGGACLFETAHKSYTKFDANDPQVAPHGYIVRANFTFTGTGPDLEAGTLSLDDIYSGRRYLRAEQLCRKLPPGEKLSAPLILRSFARDLADEEGAPYACSINGGLDGAPAEEIETGATINRHKTMSAAVIQGVRPGEDPRLTTMWTILGEPIFSVAVPCWLTESISPLLDGPKRSPLCSAAFELRNASYPKQDGELLRTERLREVWAVTLLAEDEIVRKAEAALERWRKTSVSTEAMSALHQTLAVEALGAIEQAMADLPVAAPAP